MLLTIAIPTYNRAKCLRATLLSLVTQIEQQGLRDVEIIVSDNCSTDDTPDVCASIAAAHTSVTVRYFRNDSNLGFDGNVNALFNRAAGQYVWTFSDDDTPKDKALAYVIDLLRKREVRFSFVNYEVCTKERIQASRFGANKDLWVEAPDLLKTIRFSNSLISSCIFLRSAWLAAGAEKFIGTLWIHFFVAREILQNGEALIIGQPLFTMMQDELEKSRAEKQKENRDEIEFYMRAHLKFLEFASELSHYNFDQETIQLAQTQGEREDIYQTINFKLTAPRYSLQQLAKTWQQLARFRKCRVQFWLVVTPLLVMPGWTLKLARVAYRTSKSWLR